MEYIDWLFIFYMSGTSLILMFGLYLPLLIFIGRFMYRFLLGRKIVKLPLIIVCVTIAFLAPVHDVIKTGLDMHYYCNNEHGEHIYKTAKANSVFSTTYLDDRYLLEAGFEHVEKFNNAGNLSRYELEAGTRKNYLIETPTSEFQYDRLVSNLDNNVRLWNFRILNRKNQEVLGETKQFSFRYGWLDRVTPDMGTHDTSCRKPKAYGSYKFILKVLTPSKR
jgi:hypothetical protein